MVLVSFISYEFVFLCYCLWVLVMSAVFRCSLLVRWWMVSSDVVVLRSSDVSCSVFLGVRIVWLSFSFVF